MNSFESLNFDPFSLDDITTNDDTDPDKNFFNDFDKNLHDTRYVLPDEVSNFLKENKSNSFSLLHLNIRSLRKNIDSLKILLAQLNFSFKAICLTETWFEEENASNDSLFYLPNYTCIHQVRKDRKGGSVCIYLHNSLTFRKREDLSTNSDDIESLCVEIENTNHRNTILNLVYRPPNGLYKRFNS